MERPKDQDIYKLDHSQAFRQRLRPPLMSEPDSDSTHASNALPQQQQRWLWLTKRSLWRRFNFEFALESTVTLAGVLLAWGWNLQIGTALAIICLRFLIAEVITGIVVLRLDPDRWHAIGLAALCFAAGCLRASVAGAIIFGVSVLVLFGLQAFMPNNQLMNLFLTSLSIGFMCVFGYLFLILPATLLAFLISAYTKTRISFSFGLTKLRRSLPHEKRKIVLDSDASLVLLGIGSGISLSITFLLLTILTLAQFRHPIFVLVPLFVSMILPFVWAAWFCSVVAPRRE